MKIAIALGLTAVMLAFHPLTAKANLWSISYNSTDDFDGAPVTLTGQLTTSDYSSDIGDYRVLGITGERNNLTISGLAPLSEDASFDNILTEPPGLDSSGISFFVGGNQYILFNFPIIYGRMMPGEALHGNYFERPADDFHDLTPVTLSIAAVPECSNTGLFGGCLCLGGLGVHFIWRRHTTPPLLTS